MILILLLIRKYISGELYTELWKMLPILSESASSDYYLVEQIKMP